LLGISSIVAALAIGRSTVAAVMGGVFIFLLPADYPLGIVMQMSSDQASGYRRYGNSGAVTLAAMGAAPTAKALALNYGAGDSFARGTPMVERGSPPPPSERSRPPPPKQRRAYLHRYRLARVRIEARSEMRHR
jgi:hypothetical protein